MMPNVHIFGYLFVIILAILGFLFLAMASKKESLVLLNREILNKERVLLLEKKLLVRTAHVFVF